MCGAGTICRRILSGKARFDTEPFKRNASKKYEKIARRYRKSKKKLDAGDHSKEAVQEFKAVQKLKLTLSEKKAKASHSSEAVHYLVYDIRGVRDKTKRDKTVL